MTTFELLTVASFGVFAGSLVQGTVGFGANLISVPVFEQVDPRLVPVVALMLVGLRSIAIAIKERELVDVRGLSWVLIAMIPGALAGTYVVSIAPVKVIDVLVGGGLLVGVGCALAGFRIKRTRISKTVVGCISGFMSTTSATGGPPVAFLYQDGGGGELRGSLSALFSVTVSVSLGLLAFAHHVRVGQLLTVIELIPASLLGLVCARKVSRWVDVRSARGVVAAISAIGGIVVIVGAVA